MIWLDAGSAHEAGAPQDASDARDASADASTASDAAADASPHDAQIPDGSIPMLDASPGLEAGAGDAAEGDGSACADPVDFASVRDTTFVPRCSSGRCHGGTLQGPPGPPRPSGTLNLTADVTPAELVNVPSEYTGHLLVVPGDPDRSFLYQKLVNALPSDHSLGEPMPLGEAILWQEIPESELAQLRCWIKNDAR